MKRNLITGGALGWALLIFLLSSRPPSSFDEAGGALDFIPAIDFFAHVGLYFVLAVLVHSALRTYLPERKGLLAVDTVIICLLYGVSDEFHQGFVPGRDASPVDLLADVLGAVLAVTLWLALDQFKKRRRGNGPDAERNGERDTKRS